MLFNTPPTYFNLKTFGCLAYAITLNRNKDKLDPRATKSLFLGFTIGIKGYLLFDIDKRTIFTLRNCVFHEHIFPYTPHPPITSNEIIQTEKSSNHHPFLFDHPSYTHDSPVTETLLAPVLENLPAPINPSPTSSPLQNSTPFVTHDTITVSPPNPSPISTDASTSSIDNASEDNNHIPVLNNITLKN